MGNDDDSFFGRSPSSAEFLAVLGLELCGHGAVPKASNTPTLRSAGAQVTRLYAEVDAVALSTLRIWTLACLLNASLALLSG